jgi:hypothetical protein
MLKNKMPGRCISRQPPVMMAGHWGQTPMMAKSVWSRGTPALSMALWRWPTAAGLASFQGAAMEDLMTLSVHQASSWRGVM